MIVWSKVQCWVDLVGECGCDARWRYFALDVYGRARAGDETRAKRKAHPNLGCLNCGLTTSAAIFLDFGCTETETTSASGADQPYITSAMPRKYHALKVPVCDFPQYTTPFRNTVLTTSRAESTSGLVKVQPLQPLTPPEPQSRAQDILPAEMGR